VKQRKEKKRKDYTFRRQFNEKPSIIPGCPGAVKHPALELNFIHHQKLSGQKSKVIATAQH
jgi:hypothetical protein